MISIDSTPRRKNNGTYEFELTGLSTDEKPVSLYKNMKIANGSTFFEMDTKNVKFYDEAGKTWR